MTTGQTRKYSKPLIVLATLFAIIQLYFSFQFARFSYLVDHKKEVTHPIAFEAFPFVVYNMYSGKIDDWNKYSYLKIEADGEEVKLTDFSVHTEEQVVNPAGRFLDLKQQNFEDTDLRSFLMYKLDSSKLSESVYRRAGNIFFKDNPGRWGAWLSRYTAKLLGHEVHSIKIFNCAYRYNDKGEPEKMGEELAYQYP